MEELYNVELIGATNHVHSNQSLNIRMVFLIMGQKKYVKRKEFQQISRDYHFMNWMMMS